MLKVPKSAWQSTLLAITKGGVSNVGKTTKHKEAAAFQDKMKPLPARKLCSERKMLSMTTWLIKWTDTAIAFTIGNVLQFVYHQQANMIDPYNLVELADKDINAQSAR